MDKSKLKPKPKVVETIYGILVNGELLFSFSSLLEARKKIKTLHIAPNVEKVEIIRQNVQQTLIDSYKPEVSRVLVAGDLDFDW